MAWSSFRDAMWPQAPGSEIRTAPPAHPGKGDMPSNPPSTQERLHPGAEHSPDTLPAIQPQYDPGDDGPPRPGSEVRTDLTPRTWEERYVADCTGQMTTYEPDERNS